MHTDSVLLSSSYLGPVQYYSKLISFQHVLIERFENYQKQSYRNRCIILAANGPLALSIPVFGGPGAKDPMKDLKLSYDHKWQQLHWRSIVSAYGNSPFFDYYSDNLASFYHSKKWMYLIDFNTHIQNVILQEIDFPVATEFTKAFVKKEELPANIKDYRNTIHPKAQNKNADNDFYPVKYTQVFSDKFEFQPNLSILDLLFNEGPQTSLILKSCLHFHPLADNFPGKLS